MSEAKMQQAAEAMAAGDFVAAMAIFDEVREADDDNADAHYGWADAAFMRMTIDMEEDVPAALIMRGYKRAMSLDEENLEYVAGFAGFCLDCGRLPMAVKEYSRLQKMAELQDLDVNDMLYEAAARLVEAVERLDRNAPAAQPLLAQALKWSVAGLGFTSEEAAALLSGD